MEEVPGPRLREKEWGMERGRDLGKGEECGDQVGSGERGGAWGRGGTWGKGRNVGIGWGLGKGAGHGRRGGASMPPLGTPLPSVPGASTRKLSQPCAWASVAVSLPRPGKASFDDKKKKSQNQTSMMWRQLEN